MRRILLLIVLCLGMASAAHSQFIPERVFVGPTIGLGAFGGSLAYGLGGEYALNENFGLGLSVGYTSFSEDFSSLGIPTGTLPSFDYSLLAGLAFASYHFLPNKKFDPYISLGVGYFNWNVKYIVDGQETDPMAGTSAAYASGIGFTGNLAARYHFTDMISGRITLGYPMIAGLGVDIAFGGDASGFAVDTTAPTKKVEQEEVEVPDSIRYAIYIGPYIYGKASIKTEVADASKTGLLFNVPPDFGVSIMIPFGANTNLGFAIDAGYASYGYISKPEKGAVDSNTVQERYSFINLFPHFNLAGFIIGVNLGFPSSGSSYSVRGDSLSVVGRGTIDTNSQGKVVYGFIPDPIGPNYDPAQYLATMIELRVGASIPVWTTSVGRLAVNVMAGYTLGDLFENASSYKYAYDVDPDDLTTLTLNTGLNPSIPSLSLGIQYDFRLGF